MANKIADDVEAMRAGLLRIEEEKRRILNGGDAPPEPTPLEEYEKDMYIDGAGYSHWGWRPV